MAGEKSARWRRAGALCHYQKAGALGPQELLVSLIYPCAVHAGRGLVIFLSPSSFALRHAVPDDDVELPLPRAF